MKVYYSPCNYNQNISFSAKSKKSVKKLLSSFNLKYPCTSLYQPAVDELSPEEKEKILTLPHMFDKKSFNLALMAVKNLNEEQFNIFKQLEEGQRDEYWGELKCLGKREIELYNELIKLKGAKPFDVIRAICENNCEMYRICCERGENCNWNTIRLLDEDKFNKYLSLKDRGFDSLWAYSLSFLDLDEIQLAKIKAYHDNDPEKFFSDILSSVILPMKKRENIENITDTMILALDCLRDSEYKKVRMLQEEGYSLEGILRVLTFLNKKNKIPQNSNYSKDDKTIYLKSFENDLGFEIMLEKEKEKEGIIIRKALDNNEETRREREEFEKVYASFYNPQSDRIIRSRVFFSPDMFNRIDCVETRSQTEIILDENREPQKIIYSRRDKRRPDFWIREEFTLADYPQDLDVIQEIKKGNLQGKKLSYVVEDDESYTYHEDFSKNGFHIQRRYKTNSYDSGLNKEYEYSYTIENQKTKEKIQSDITFKREYNHSTTTINGVKYDAYFDDEKQTITIKWQDKEKIINVLSKTAGNKPCFDVLKNLSANLLLELDKNTDTIFWGRDPYYARGGGILQMSSNYYILAHELGHAICDCDVPKNYRFLGKPVKTFIDDDIELKKTYYDEFKRFEKRYTKNSGIKALSYFLPYSLSSYQNHNGLDEMTAETYMLLNYPCGFKDSINYRSFHLIENFPQTFCHLAKLINENSAVEIIK